MSNMDPIKNRGGTRVHVNGKQFKKNVDWILELFRQYGFFQYIEAMYLTIKRYYSVTNWLFLYWPWYRFDISNIGPDARRAEGQYC